MATATIPAIVGSSAARIIRDSTKILSKLKKVDPRDRYVLLFPSSDAAHVGMAFKLLTCKPAEDVFEQASEMTKIDILRLCLKGPREDLYDSMENRDLATFVTSHATLAKLGEERPNVIADSKACGGFGIGFMNCLVFSGAMSFKNALDYIQRQGRALDKAAAIVPSAKVKVRFMPATSKIRVCKAAIEHCKRNRVPEEIAKCSVTKQSHAHVLEIAGHEEAIKFLETEGSRLFRFRYISRVRNLPRAFHTDLMQPVQHFMREYINQRMKEDPDFLKDPETSSVHSSIAARRLRVKKYIMKDLINFPVRPVLTEQLLHLLYARPASVPQPNTIVLWDQKLRQDLSMVNCRAWRSSQLYT